jgi:hypothetical protein
MVVIPLFQLLLAQAVAGVALGHLQRRELAAVAAQAVAAELKMQQVQQAVAEQLMRALAEA